MDNGRERIDRIAVQEDVDLDELRLLVVRELVVKRSVAARRRFQTVEVVEDNLVERDVVRDHDAVRVKVVHALELAALVLRDLHDGTDEIVRHNDRGLDVRLLDVLDLRLRRQFGRVADLDHRTVRLVDVIDDGRCRRDELEVVLALEALLDDIHVQEAEEAAAETEAECNRRLRLKDERRIVDLHLLERVLEVVVVRALDRVKAAVDHRVDAAIARQRLSSRVLRIRDCVADAHIAHILEGARDEADFADIEVTEVNGLRLEAADVGDLEDLARVHELELHALLDVALHDADVGDDALVGVKERIEDQGRQRRVLIAFRRGDVVDDRVEDLLDANARLSRSQHGI